jgi:hypothetical protein
MLKTDTEKISVEIITKKSPNLMQTKPTHPVSSKKPRYKKHKEKYSKAHYYQNV